MSTIPTNRGAMTAGQLIADLTYINYAVNRDASPDITPEQWATIYPRAAELEARYQAERAPLRVVHVAGLGDPVCQKCGAEGLEANGGWIERRGSAYAGPLWWECSRCGHEWGHA